MGDGDRGAAGARTSRWCSSREHRGRGLAGRSRGTPGRASAEARAASGPCPSPSLSISSSPRPVRRDGVGVAALRPRPRSARVEAGRRARRRRLARPERRGQHGAPAGQRVDVVAAGQPAYGAQPDAERPDGGVPSREQRRDVAHAGPAVDGDDLDAGRVGRGAAPAARTTPSLGVLHQVGGQLGRDDRDLAGALLVEADALGELGARRRRTMPLALARSTRTQATSSAHGVPGRRPRSPCPLDDRDHGALARVGAAARTRRPAGGRRDRPRPRPVPVVQPSVSARSTSAMPGPSSANAARTPRRTPAVTTSTATLPPPP